MNRLNNKGVMLRMTVLLFLLVLSSFTEEMAGNRNQIRKDIFYLASEQLGGRKPGEKGDLLAAKYIRDQFRKAGLSLMGEKGFQPFELVASVELGETNQLTVSGVDCEPGKDFQPYSFSSASSLSAKTVFAGYGFDIQTDSLNWNDYKNLDVEGKWVIILKGDPEIDKPDSKFAPYSEERSKVLTALDHKAGGVLLVGGPVYAANDQLQGLFYDKNSSVYPIPVMQVTRKIADQLLQNSGTSVAQLEDKLNKNSVPASFEMESTVAGKADVLPHKVLSNNVMGILHGTDPLLRNEYIIIGAHYDHLGSGGPGSGSRVADTLAIHYGADDNASGVAAVLDLARYYSKAKMNRRSLVFVAFGAEEMGLIGSKSFVNNPPVDLKKTTAMFNFDMVGRLDNQLRSLSIGGTQTALETEGILNQYNTGFNLTFSGEGVGPSDHASFYLQNIPVFFFSTAAHPDYHTPGDTPDKINMEGIAEIRTFASRVITEISSRDQMLTFREAGSKVMRSRGGRFKVTLGIIPDYAGMEKSGMKVDGVTKGKPAEKGGMQKGDIITAINGKPVGNIYDYMNRLKTFEEGQTISVDLIRNGQPLVLIIQL